MEIPRLNPGNGRDAVLVAHLRAGPFLLTRKRYSGGFRQGWHEHPIASIDFVIGGGGLAETTGERDECGAGGIGFDPAGLRHRYRCAPCGTETVHLVMTPRTLEEEEVGRHLRRTLRGTRSYRILLGFVRALASPDRSAALHVESAAREMVGMLRPDSRDGRVARSRLRPAVELLHEATHRTVGLGELAEASGLSRGHFARAFRRAFGVTPGAYHRELRLAAAARRLARSHEPISRVAYALGFADQAHLTRLFREHIGVTPRAYRRALGVSGAGGSRSPQSPTR